MNLYENYNGLFHGTTYFVEKMYNSKVISEQSLNFKISDKESMPS